MGLDQSVILTRSKLLADRLRPWYFSNLPKDIFFDPTGQKFEDIAFLTEIFHK